MKKIPLIFVLLVALPLISAVQINMSSSFSQGETLTAQIFGNFISPPQQQDILLYNGHVRVSFVPYLLQNNGIYYIYGQLLGKSPGNYSLVLTGVNYLESGKIQTSDVSKNFTISNSTADFSISPGFVKTSDDFFINVQSFSDSFLSVNSFLSEQGSSSILQGSENTSILFPEESKKIYFSVAGLNSSVLEASLSSANTFYSIPVFFTSTSQSGISGSASSVLEIQPSEFNVLIPTSSSTIRYVFVHNPGANYENVSLNISKDIGGYIYIANKSFVLGPNSTNKIEIDITSRDNETVTSGLVDFVFGNVTKSVYLFLNFSKNYAASGSGGSSGSVFQNCSQLGGIKCNDSEACSIDTVNALDGPCCLGTCQIPPAKNNAGKAIGWSLVAVVVVFLAIFFVKRYAKAKRRPVSFLRQKK